MIGMVHPEPYLATCQQSETLHFDRANELPEKAVFLYAGILVAVDAEDQNLGAPVCLAAADHCEDFAAVAVGSAAQSSIWACSLDQD